MTTKAFGSYVRSMRMRAGISLRQLARTLGISAVYLGEVERGVRATMPRERWAALVSAVPALTLEGLERSAAKTAPLQLDLTEAPVQYRNIAHALARRIDRRDLTARDFDQLFEVLDEWKEDDDE